MVFILDQSALIPGDGCGVTTAKLDFFLSTLINTTSKTLEVGVGVRNW